MLQLNFAPFPEFKTERLLLRRMVINDAPAVFFLRSDPAVLQFLSKAPAASIEEAVKFMNNIDGDIDSNNGILWIITLHNNPAVAIGTICYWRIDKEHHRAEIGYALHPQYWKKGIMKEAIGKILDYGFNLMQLHSVEARINPNNKASAALLGATGFVKEAYFKEDFHFNGKFEDTAVYSRLLQ